MCYRIGIEDLVANALIERLEKDDSMRFVSYKELESYGAEVISILSENQENVTLILSRADTYHLLADFSDFFEEKTIADSKGIELKEGKDISSLSDRFRGYLPLSVLLAFIEAKNILSSTPRA